MGYTKLPRQKLSITKKDKKWREECVEAFINLSNSGAGYSQKKDDLNILYDYYNGVIDEGDYNYVLKPFLSSNVNDQLSGFFLIKKDSFKNLNFDEIFYGYGDFYFRLIYFMNKLNKKIYEFPIIYEERKFGVSKTKFLNIFLKYTFEAIKFRFFLWIK